MWNKVKLWETEGVRPTPPPNTCFLFPLRCWRPYDRQQGVNWVEKKEILKKACGKIFQGMWPGGCFILHLQGGCAIMACSVLIGFPMVHVLSKGLFALILRLLWKKTALTDLSYIELKRLAVGTSETGGDVYPSCYHLKAYSALHGMHFFSMCAFWGFKPMTFRAANIRLCQSSNRNASCTFLSQELWARQILKG